MRELVGLREQTVRDARNFAETHERHRWRIPEDYNVTTDALVRNQRRKDDVCLYYEDEEGRGERYTFGRMLEHEPVRERAEGARASAGRRRGHPLAGPLQQGPRAVADGS